MASFIALKAGNWGDTTIWAELAPNPGSPAGPPAAGDLVQLAVSGTFSGDGSIAVLQIVDVSVTFTGNIAASDSFSMTNAIPSTPMTVAVSGGGISGGNEIAVGSGVQLTVSGGASVVGPNSGTIGLQNSGTIVVNDGSISSDLLSVDGGGTLDLESGSATLTTLDVAGPFDFPVSLTIGSGGSISDTIATFGSIINGIATATISGQWDNQQLTIGDEGTAEVTVDSGGAMIASGSGTALTVGGGPFAHATLALAGGIASDAGDLLVALRGTGEIALTSGGSLDVSGSLRAGGSADGVGILQLDTGTLTVGGNATVGDLGAGTVTLAAGGATITGTLTLGAQAGGKGMAELTGASALLDTDALVVGGGGIATASVADQAEISTGGDVIVGASQDRQDSGGTLTLQTGGALSDGGNLIVGDGGTGAFATNGGTVNLLGSEFIVGNAAKGNGDVSIQNGTIAVIGTVTMGNLGRASVSVNTQGMLTATSIVIGAEVGSNGGFALDGSGSSAQSGDITIGDAGVGSAQVTNKAALHTTGNATIASQGGPVQQTMTIDTRASWQIGGVLQVGEGGPADLAVQGGGQVGAASVVVADLDGADGTVSVTGTGSSIPSALSFTSSLTIGNGGSGTLQVTGGASVGPAVAGDGTVAIGALAGGSGTVSLTGTGSALSTSTLAVGGDATAAGGTGALSIGVGATVTVHAATIWPSGAVTLAGGALMTDPATVNGTLSGFGNVGGAVTNTGTIVADGGTLTMTGNLSGAGATTINGGAALRLAVGDAAATTVGMAAGGAVLLLDDLAATRGTIAGFAIGDTIDVNGISADGEQFAAGVLTLTSTGVPVGTLAVSGSFSSASFRVSPTATGVAITVACLAKGTRIATARGDIPVEDLRLGDRVLTARGSCEPIRWIGHRLVDCQAHPDPRAAWPVCITAGALGRGLPARDVFLSPDHALFIDGLLMPAGRLVNGATVRQERRDAVAYWHLELPRHGVLLAEGLPVESYLDTGNRAGFEKTSSADKVYLTSIGGR